MKQIKIKRKDIEIMQHYDKFDLSVLSMMNMGLEDSILDDKKLIQSCKEKIDGYTKAIHIEKNENFVKSMKLKINNEKKYISSIEKDIEEKEKNLRLRRRVAKRKKRFFNTGLTISKLDQRVAC